MSTASKALEQAAAHAKAGKLEACLGSLLTAWERLPAEAVREVTLLVDDALGAPAFEGDWLKAAKKATPAERGPLLAALKAAKLSESQARLGVAAEWRDPRTTRALEQLLGEVPWSSDSSKPTWNAAFAVIEASGDARFVELAGTLPKQWKVREGIKGWLERSFARAIAKLPKEAPSLDAADAKQLEAIRAALSKAPSKKPKGGGSRDEAQLLEDIYANPGDDAPRLVLADVLQEKGDPRGEFIALQMSGADEKRAKALLKQHGKKWLGALGPVLGADFEFRRGFPAVGLVKFRHQADAEKYGNLPEWATFEELTWSASYPPVEQIPYCRWAGPSMRWLKKAVNVHLPHLLGSKDPWPNLEELEAEFGPTGLEELAAAWTKFPGLRTVIVGPATADWFANVRSLGSVKVLGVNARDFGELVPIASRLGVEELRVGEMLTFRRGSDGHLSKLTVNVPKGARIEPYTWRIGQVPANLVESVDFELGEGVTLTADVEKAAKAKVKTKGAVSAFEAAAKAAAGPAKLEKLDRVCALEVLPNGRLFVAEPERVRLVDLETLEVNRTIPARLSAAVVVAQGTRAVLSSYKTMTVLDLEKGVALSTTKVQSEPTSPLQVSEDGCFVSFARAAVFDVEKLEELDGPRGSGKAMVLSPDRTWWVRWKKNGEPYEVFREGSSKGVPLEGGATFTGPTIRGGYLYGRTPDALVKWDVATGKAVARLAVKEGDSLWLSRDGKLVATREKNAVVVADGETLAKVCSVPVKGWASCVGLGPGTVLVATDKLEQFPLP